MKKNQTKPAAARRRPQPKRRLPWPVWIGLGGLVLVLAGIAFLARPGTTGLASRAASVTPEVTGQAKLAVDRDKIDFGTLPLDKTVDATFKLTNVGDKPLQIEGQPTIQVQKGC